MEWRWTDRCKSSYLRLLVEPGRKVVSYGSNPSYWASLIVANSIEGRILQLQEKKQAMVDSTIGELPVSKR